jgi:hypothetical protein
MQKISNADASLLLNTIPRFPGAGKPKPPNGPNPQEFFVVKGVSNVMKSGQFASNDHQQNLKRIKWECSQDDIGCGYLTSQPG